jgi:hypothetical protein
MALGPTAGPGCTSGNTTSTATGSSVDQQVSLSSDSSWWAGVGEQEGDNSGYPLSAEFHVDNSHYYAIWIWGGTDVYGAGWSTFWGSAAGGDLSAAIPSITWELN